MSWVVRVRPEAELDLLLAAGWYEGRRAGLGDAFINEIEPLITSLADNALLYPVRSNGIRLAFARRFPYAVSFRIQDGAAVVMSVLHMRRDRPEE